MEYITQDVIEFIVQDFSVEYDEAMRLFYHSAVFEKLRDPETSLYLESPAYVYNLFQDEMILEKSCRQRYEIQEQSAETDSVHEPYHNSNPLNQMKKVGLLRPSSKNPTFILS